MTLLAAIKAIHAEHPAYGSPRIHAQLLAQGHHANLGTIEKLMRDNDIFASTKRKFRVITTDSKHDFPIADNLLDRNFRAFRPNEKWLADITYIPTGEGRLYLAAVMDLCTRKIVGWAMRDHMRTELASSALMMAIQRQRQRPGKGLIHHSDPRLREDGSRMPPTTTAQHCHARETAGTTRPWSASSTPSKPKSCIITH